MRLSLLLSKLCCIILFPLVETFFSSAPPPFFFRGESPPSSGGPGTPPFFLFFWSKKKESQVLFPLPRLVSFPFSIRPVSPFPPVAPHLFLFLGVFVAPFFSPSRKFLSFLRPYPLPHLSDFPLTFSGRFFLSLLPFLFLLLKTDRTLSPPQGRCLPSSGRPFLPLPDKGWYWSTVFFLLLLVPEPTNAYVVFHYQKSPPFSLFPPLL